jgi:MFS family permease
MGWAISTACTAATKNYGGLLATRIVSGAFESVVPPAMMLLSSQWYTKSEAAPRFSLWYLGTGLGQIIGGLVSWAFQHVSLNAPLAGWRIM